MDRSFDPELAFRQFDTLYIETPRHKAINTALEESLRMMTRTSGSDMRHLLITGDSGMGKSLTLKRFMDRANGKAQQASPDALPVIYVNTPEDATPKAMSTAMLESLNDLFPGKAPHHKQMIRVRELMDELGIRMVIFDEFQHLFEGRSHGAAKTATQFVKNLANTFGRPIVLAGMPSIERFVQGSAELRRRFSTRLRIGRYRLKATDHQQFRDFLTAAEAALPLPSEEPLTSARMRLAFYCISGGIPDYIVKPLKLALSRALDRGQTTLRVTDIVDAASSLLDPDGQVINPFEQEVPQLRRVIRMFRSLEEDPLRRLEAEFAQVRFLWLDDL